MQVLLFIIGCFIARFTSKTGKRKTLYDFKLNELKRKLREAIYEDEHGLNGNGENKNHSYYNLSDMFDKVILSEHIRKNPYIGIEMPPQK